MDRLMVLGPHHSSYIPDIVSIIRHPEVLQGKSRGAWKTKGYKFQSTSTLVALEFSASSVETSGEQVPLAFAILGCPPRVTPTGGKGCVTVNTMLLLKKKVCLYVPEFDRFETLFSQSTPQ